jgi:acid phosphatase family membrane protein YuiD
MEWLSHYLVAVVVAWVISNLIKTVIQSIQVRKFSQRSMFSTGGMPSVHTAPVAALTTVIGLSDGVQSATFVISLILAVVVMTDAVKVRRAVGEQGDALNKILPKSQPKPYFAKGHKLIEVAVGAAIGIVVGITTYFVV